MKPDVSHTVRTLRLRLKDQHSALLLEHARAVNCVWSFCNELSVKHFERQRAFLSAHDMQPYTKGAGKELGLHSQTVQTIQEEYVTRRKQFKKVKLRWRVSGGARRSLGWIPFKASAVRYKVGQVWYAGQPLSLWDSHGLSHYELGAGSFSEDSRGRWYFNVTVKTPELVGPPAPKPITSVGIDLGLKAFLTTSDGEAVNAHRFYRDLEPQLAGRPAGRQETPCQGTPREGREPSQRCLAQTQYPAGQQLWGDLCWRRERFRPGTDTDGEIRARRRLEPVQNHAAVQVR